ncbi:uncharacterized protein [Rutidosis leptorrhynchoides]|uniref:uncharacterized protein n=1 Tax=Rutidosis leptorrhynchoides TaxID=125765 RepID=UPI003A9A23C8
MEAKHELQVSKFKAYRALSKAKQILKGDYIDQYADMRDYLEELVRCNPGTSVRVQTENNNPKAKTHVFKRVYICLGVLKQGFKTTGRDLLGVDGAFMKEPATGHMLTAVGIDCNNGIYPVAYAIVEQECFSSWEWFLKLLAEDLEITPMSNFTFISDRQKGLLPAIQQQFPCDEHRFCLRHIHENMKTKGWRGHAFKNYLWNCARATTVPQFERAMLEMKKLDARCLKYLADIPPKHWARSHFSHRTVSDVLLNNMCEVLNRWLCDARDKPIVTALEYIREYLMKRIANVLNVAAKSDGPLTPTATKLFDVVKREANSCGVLWNGTGQYQVNGPHGDQVVVDMQNRSCACRKWEITGMPCKHVVACLYNMTENSMEVGRELWVKSSVRVKLLPPKKIKTAGRPKKSRSKSMDEKEDANNRGKLTRKGKTVQCGKCKLYGHNSRGCGDDGNDGKKRKMSSEAASKKKGKGHVV